MTGQVEQPLGAHGPAVVQRLREHRQVRFRQHRGDQLDRVEKERAAEGAGEADGLDRLVLGGGLQRNLHYLPLSALCIHPVQQVGRLAGLQDDVQVRAGLQIRVAGVEGEAQRSESSAGYGSVRSERHLPRGKGLLDLDRGGHVVPIHLRPLRQVQLFHPAAALHLPAPWSPVPDRQVTPREYLHVLDQPDPVGAGGRGLLDRQRQLLHAEVRWGEFYLQPIGAIPDFAQRDGVRPPEGAQVGRHPADLSLTLEQRGANHGEDRARDTGDQGRGRRGDPDRGSDRVIRVLSLDDADLLVGGNIGQQVHLSRWPADLQAVHLGACTQAEMRHALIFLASPTPQYLPHLRQLARRGQQTTADTIAVALDARQFHPQPVIVVAVVAVESRYFAGKGRIQEIDEAILVVVADGYIRSVILYARRGCVVHEDTRTVIQQEQRLKPRSLYRESNNQIQIAVVVDIRKGRTIRTGSQYVQAQTHAFRDIQELTVAQVQQHQRTKTRLIRSSGGLEDIQVAVVVDVAYGDAECFSLIGDLPAGGIPEATLTVAQKQTVRVVFYPYVEIGPAVVVEIAGRQSPTGSSPLRLEEYV